MPSANVLVVVRAVFVPFLKARSGRKAVVAEARSIRITPQNVGIAWQCRGRKANANDLSMLVKDQENTNSTASFHHLSFAWNSCRRWNVHHNIWFGSACLSLERGRLYPADCPALAFRIWGEVYYLHQLSHPIRITYQSFLSTKLPFNSAWLFTVSSSLTMVTGHLPETIEAITFMKLQLCSPDKQQKLTTYLPRLSAMGASSAEAEL